jgi:uncharacterized protein (TIGR02284 family)
MYGCRTLIGLFFIDPLPKSLDFRVARVLNRLILTSQPLAAGSRNFGGKEMINEHEKATTYTTESSLGPENKEFNEKTIATLNDLIETCKDAQEGFKQAAEGVTSLQLKDTFMQYSQERGGYVADLQNLVRTLGGDPEDSGSTAGALHRGWMNIKSAVTGNDDAAILNECERGEDSAKNTYKEAQKEDLPGYIRDVVETQFNGVLAAHDHVRTLRDAANNKTASAAKPVL